VIALFADDAESSLRVIRHVREGAQGTPVWLYSTAQPPPGVTALCNHVVVCGNPVRLLLTAQRQLWPRRAALAVGTWTGRGGSGLLKLCPFLVPPFRSLFLNRNGDFLPGTPKHIAVHCRHRLSERAHELPCDAVKSPSHLAALRYHIWLCPVRRARDHTAAAALSPWPRFAAGASTRTATSPAFTAITRSIQRYPCVRGFTEGSLLSAVTIGLRGDLNSLR
jgi:hypothetical protein